MPATNTSRIRIVLQTIGGVCVVAVAGLAAVGWMKRGNLLQEAQTGSSPSLPLSVIACGDTAGWIIPCGCTSNQSGGLLRRGSFVANERKTSEVVLVDVGGAPGGTSPYDRVKFEAILQGELEMGTVAHNLGGPEIKFGRESLRELVTKFKVPFISANIRDTAGNLITQSSRMVEAGGKRLLIVGVISPRYATSGLRISSPGDAVLAVADRYRNQYDWLVVLAYLPEEELRKLASELPEADVILGGPTQQSIAPLSVGPTTLAAATNKGKFLVHLRAPSGNRNARWTGRVVELDDGFPDDPAQKQNLQKYYSELQRRDFTAAQTGFSPSLPVNPPPGYRISGTSSCLKCHSRDCREWEQSSHAHAWETLSESRAHLDSDCQRCHTTGFGMPGGFASARRSLSRVNVGCESCHGPSQAHVEDFKTKTPFTANDQCIHCHDRENSPDFNSTEYWDQIRHGQRPEASDASQNSSESKTETQP